MISSFNFKAQQEEDFRDKTAAYDSLLTLPIPYLVGQDSLRLESLSGNTSVVVFWASWSDRSASIMAELHELQQQNAPVNIVAALVMDATATAIPEFPDYDFKFIDGTRLFNELRVPGIPSYFVLDASGKPVITKVGFREGEVSKVLTEVIKQ